MAPVTDPTPAELSRAAISIEHRDLATEVAFAYCASLGTPDEWSIPTLTMRIAGAIKIAADRARDEVLAEYAAICTRPLCTEYRKNDDMYCSDGCDEAHELAVRSDAALDDTTSAFMTARQFGEVAV